MNLRSFRLFALSILASALLGSACVRKVTVSDVLPVNAPLTTDELINRINAYGEVRTFSAQVDVVVRNYFTGVGTKAEEFPEATGLIRFQRPESTRMRVTFLGKKVADMVSDGQRFRLAVYYPTDKRRFVSGSNLKEVDRMDPQELKEAKNPELSQAGGLVNMRPQHITNSFLIKAISSDSRNDVFREEARLVEPDTRPGRKNRFVERTYYVVYVLEHGDKGQSKLRRKFWFDRTQPDTPLVRQQTFENGEGKLASDDHYSKWFTIPNSNLKWPGLVIIDRRSDGYRLEMGLEKDTVEVNQELPETTFVLENTEKLEELNLDAPRKASANSGRKPPSSN
ncbi:MAG TPA: hypothetical protein VNI02_14735 [Blastocatellia bacterium]|jgi:hypothetical protein|nr:hypothetical protein [Blastocatellia bacterium]